MAARALVLVSFLLSSSSTFAAVLEKRPAAPTCINTLLTPIPARLHCEEKGAVARPRSSVISATAQNTLELCRDSCISNTTCISFAFGASNQCTLYKAKLNDMGFKAATNGAISSNRACYSCKCTAGLSKCPGGSCVDLKTSANNCGACGKQCPTGTTCQNGACGCPSGGTACNGTCVDTQTNSDNCGACGTSCGDNEFCQGGQCLCQAATPLSGLAPCKGSCTVDFQSDNNNCGSCDTQCTVSGTSCKSGSCQCADSSQQVCNEACVNTLVDPCNCGTCGTSCASGQVCSQGSCKTSVPPVVLTNPIPITTMFNGLGFDDLDDDSFHVTLPFEISLFGTNTSTVWVSVNGWMGFEYPTNGFTESQLPTDRLPPTTFIPFMDDLYIYSGTTQGIYYQVVGDAPQRTLAFEWYTSHITDDRKYYHFVMELYEAKPGATTFRYYQVYDAGASAVVGVQKASTNQFAQWSLDQPAVPNGMVLTYDPVTNTFNPGGCSA